MTQYVVTVPQVVYAYVVVDADSPEEAEASVREGGGLTEMEEYSCTLFNGEAGTTWAVAECQGADFRDPFFVAQLEAAQAAAGEGGDETN